MLRNKASESRFNTNNAVAKSLQLPADSGRFTLDSAAFFKQFKAFDPSGKDEIIFPLEQLIKVEELNPVEHMDFVELFDRMYGPHYAGDEV